MKTATIEVSRYDCYDEVYKEYEYEMPLSVEDMESLISWTPEKIRTFLYENCVGIRPCVGNEKFIPCIEIGKLRASLQVNYYVWSIRSEKLFERGVHYGNKYDEEMEKMTTKEEFNQVIPDNETYIDVKFDYDGVRLFLGQMTLSMVSETFNELAVNLRTTFEE